MAAEAGDDALSVPEHVVAEVTDDYFLAGRVRLQQPARGYRAGLDAVLLAAAAPVEPGANVLDAGAGVGAVGLCVAARVVDARITLVEREPALVRLAASNCALNGWDARVSVIAADVCAPATVTAAAGLPPDSMDHVLANPPYYVDGEGTAAARQQRAVSRSMDAGALDQWVRFAARMTRASGTVTLIHRVEALGELLASVEQRFGAITIRPLAARDGAPATRVIVSAKKGSRAPLRLLAPLVLHEADGSFSPIVRAVIDHAAALE